MEVQLLQDIIDDYERGTLDMTQLARKCYLTERDKMANRTTWVHNDELKNHSLLRSMSKTSAKRDLLQNRSLL